LRPPVAVVGVQVEPTGSRRSWWSTHAGAVLARWPLPHPGPNVAGSARVRGPGPGHRAPRIRVCALAPGRPETIADLGLCVPPTSPTPPSVTGVGDRSSGRRWWLTARSARRR